MLVALEVYTQGEAKTPRAAPALTGATGHSTLEIAEEQQWFWLHRSRSRLGHGAEGDPDPE